MAEVRREEGNGEAGRKQKGRLIQERDRLALVLVGMNRVVRERSLRKALFPGRDESTFANRVWELARDLKPVGAYWTSRRRVLEDGGVERYLALTDIGYRQAEQLVGAGWFERQPTDQLKPSHIEHDLDLADFALALLPRRTEQYQPKVKGKPAGEPSAVEVPILPRRWRWQHASVSRRLTVFEGKKDREGRWVAKPSIALAFEPDAILETETFNCTRYFVEWDRGTEPIAGRESRTILDKLQRIRRYFWGPRGLVDGPHWSEQRSYYLKAFTRERLLRPKVLLITTSTVRAANIRRLASSVFNEELASDEALESFIEVLTVDEASRKLCRVLALAEASAPPREWPWLRELRERDVAVARAQADRKRRLKEEARLDPLWVPYDTVRAGTGRCSPLQVDAEDGHALVAWADEMAAAGTPLDWQGFKASARDVIERIRAVLHPPLAGRVGAALRLTKAPVAVELSADEIWFLLKGANAALRRTEEKGLAPMPTARHALAILGIMLFHYRASPGDVPQVVTGARAAWGDDAASPWAVAREQR